MLLVGWQKGNSTCEMYCCNKYNSHKFSVGDVAKWAVTAAKSANSTYVKVLVVVVDCLFNGMLIAVLLLVINKCIWLVKRFCHIRVIFPVDVLFVGSKDRSCEVCNTCVLSVLTVHIIT